LLSKEKNGLTVSRKSTRFRGKDLQLNLYGVGSIVGILILTVMMQEYHIPYVSTQKLFIPCEKPEESSLAFWANDALDFSSGAQKIWSRLLGRNGLISFY